MVYPFVMICGLFVLILSSMFFGIFITVERKFPFILLLFMFAGTLLLGTGTKGMVDEAKASADHPCVERSLVP